ncbi:MAG: fold metallo-hydrolase [Rhodospirillales bacterium]|nr:fold metallo-hydrolase [Rhodospirillales bacterium]
MKPIALGDFTIRKFVESTGNMGVPAGVFSGLGGERLKTLCEAMDPRCGDPASALFYISMHSFVLQTGSRTILIDTCNGNGKRRTGVMAGMNMLNHDYLGNLAQLGLKPEDIDVVLCTHLHSDHVGWNTRLENGAWVPTFANARYLMSEIDVEVYGSLPPEHPQYPLTRESFEDSVLPVLASGQAELIRTGHVVEHEVGNGVWLEGCPGHTPGNMVIHAQSGPGRHAVFTGDVFHHPVQIQDTILNLNVDADPEAGLATRRRFVETYADTGTILLAAHFPDPTAGCVVTDRAGPAFRFLDPLE